VNGDEERCSSSRITEAPALNPGVGLFQRGEKTTTLAATLRQPLPVYHSRLLREDRAALVRLRCVRVFQRTYGWFWRSDTCRGEKPVCVCVCACVCLCSAEKKTCTGSEPPSTFNKEKEPRWCEA
jgi:hypothetical protein